MSFRKILTNLTLVVFALAFASQSYGAPEVVVRKASNLVKYTDENQKKAIVRDEEVLGKIESAPKETVKAALNMSDAEYAKFQEQVRVLRDSSTTAEKREEVFKEQQKNLFKVVTGANILEVTDKGTFTGSAAEAITARAPGEKLLHSLTGTANSVKEFYNVRSSVGSVRGLGELLDIQHMDNVQNGKKNDFAAMKGWAQFAKDLALAEGRTGLPVKDKAGKMHNYKLGASSQQDLRTALDAQVLSGASESYLKKLEELAFSPESGSAEDREAILKGLGTFNRQYVDAFRKAIIETAKELNKELGPKEQLDVNASIVKLYPAVKNKLADVFKSKNKNASPEQVKEEVETRIAQVRSEGAKKLKEFLEGKIKDKSITKQTADILACQCTPLSQGVCALMNPALFQKEAAAQRQLTPAARQSVLDTFSKKAAGAAVHP
jgi:hypothetical protein